MSDKSNIVNSTGFAMWIQKGVVHMAVQTTSQLYKATFDVSSGSWVHYTVTWSQADGLEVYDNALVCQLSRSIQKLWR